MPFKELADALPPLLSWIGDASIIVIGGSSDGTAEFLALRSLLTRALIATGGVRAILNEGDWVDAARINRHISPDHAAPDDTTALVRQLTASPSWRWQNQPMVDFLTWLRRENATAAAPVEFYGLDCHNWYNCVHSLLGTPYRPSSRTDAATYACVQSLGCNLEGNVWPDHCPTTAGLLSRLSRELAATNSASQGFGSGGPAPTLAMPSQQQSERFFFKLLGSRINGRNARSQHQAETLDLLHRRWINHHPPAPDKVIVWAHNSQVGDSRYTELGLRGETSLGQLLRMRYGSAVRLLGMTTFQGELLAAPVWRGAPRVTSLVPTIPESFEWTFHQFGVPRFFWPFPQSTPRPPALVLPRAQRSFGTIYHPDSDRTKNYYTADIRGQFDAIVHFDRTHALSVLPSGLNSTQDL